MFVCLLMLPVYQRFQKFEGDNPQMRLVLPAEHKGFYSNNVDNGRLSLSTMFSDTSSNHLRL